MSIYSDFISEDTQKKDTPKTTSPYADFIQSDVQEEEKKKESWFAKTGKNLLKGIISAPKTVVESAIGAGKAIKGGKPILPQDPGEYMKNMQRSMVESGRGMAKWTYETPVNLAKHPLEQISQDPLGTAAWLGMAAGAGVKGVKGMAGKLKPTEPVKPTIAPEPLPLTPKDRIMQALKESKPLRKEQEQIYARERAAKFEKAETVGQSEPTESGYYKQLHELKGEHTKVEFEALREKVGQPDIDALFKDIEEHPGMVFTDKLPAKKGLVKILDGQLPQPNEVARLQQVFGPELVAELMKKQSLFKRAKNLGLEIANTPRAIMASADLSFGLRQGVIMAASHPAIFAKNWIKQFSIFKSEKAFKAVNDEISSRPTYDLMRKSKLDLMDIGRDLLSREERFMSPLAEQIPMVGKVVRASSRAYTGFANKLRADVFDYLVKRADDMGYDPFKTAKVAEDIANVVNTASGRGSLGKLGKAGPLLNSIFFSPRLMASRLSILNPMYYMKLSRFARMEALKSSLAFVGAGTTILGLAKMFGGDVGTDSRSANFGKLQIGDTKIDIWGGFAQYARLAGQLVTGEVKSGTTGKITKLGEGYRPLTRSDIASRFVEYKEAPILSFATGLLRGSSSIGQDFKIGPEIAKRFIPMVIQDAVEIAKNDPSLIPLTSLGVFGVGLQTYGLDNPKNPLGAELNRLKLSLKWVSRLPNKDKLHPELYEQLSQQSQDDITMRLNKLIASPDWAKLTDEQKTKIIQHQINLIKRGIMKPYLEQVKANND